MLSLLEHLSSRNLRREVVPPNAPEEPKLLLQTSSNSPDVKIIKPLRTQWKEYSPVSLYVETDFVGPSNWGDELGIQRGFVEETATELSRVARQCQGIVVGQVSTKASLERKSPHRHQSALHHLVQSTVHTVLYFYISDSRRSFCVKTIGIIKLCFAKQCILFCLKQPKIEIDITSSRRMSGGYHTAK